jgi:hypothetical protein
MIRAAQARAARKRYREMASVLNEQSRRRFVALEARALGRGGISLMAGISGLSRSTIYHALSDIEQHVSAAPEQVRKRMRDGSAEAERVREQSDHGIAAPTPRGSRQGKGQWPTIFEKGIDAPTSFLVEPTPRCHHAGMLYELIILSLAAERVPVDVRVGHLQRVMRKMHCGSSREDLGLAR